MTFNMKETAQKIPPTNKNKWFCYIGNSLSYLTNFKSINSVPNHPHVLNITINTTMTFVAMIETIYKNQKYKNWHIIIKCITQKTIVLHAQKSSWPVKDNVEKVLK